MLLFQINYLLSVNYDKLEFIYISANAVISRATYSYF